ncbi:MAG: hypothetical protein A2928_02275 [Candidatus Taylorbacteria bacterium RIFCSPLOWO2_01_FULL_45_15b]|uniref:DUF4015 domain-containing protein n=1 Tax=Candidatus Taylorbacteria bacterium RIFCSPLOWO2_01_FULL_45_15b TaxID=1802319 RepID=A0A1G2NCI5_9BACT|nr:MAG: hypothetical protein A2928_02275 [Candidatus Taylorbacteria bacterium RIFCSPLOWO2_01_FULL_45_15b]
MPKKSRNRVLSFALAAILIAGFVIVASYFVIPNLVKKSYDEISFVVASTPEWIPPVVEEKKKKIAHLQTPEPLKGIYMTSWVAGTPRIRKDLVALVETTEINSIVIDIKDYTGKIAYKPNDFDLEARKTYEERITDLSAFIEELHTKNIYVIGRIAAFQDPAMIHNFPEEAVKRKSDGSVWKDYKGIAWMDPASETMWEYLVEIAEDAHAQGFDEINFDYIRFPSDGNMKDIAYPVSGDRVKREVMSEFFAYVGRKLKESDMVISADLFGLTTSASGDLNIGQVLEDALPHFDYVAPMVYPSHYPDGFNGFKNPADHPYEIIKFAMDEAVKKTEAASTTISKIRPWLQDFDLGADYGPEEVRAQIQATNDAGLTSWLLWSASNRYTKEALLAE